LFGLLEECSKQLGVDPDAVSASVIGEHLKTRWPIQVCYLHEVDNSLLAEFGPELILLPEIVEHVPDAGSLLGQVRDLAQRFGAEVVLTVPNALAGAAISGWIEGVETMHPDHVCSYTPRNLQTLLEKCQLSPREIRPYYWGKPPRPIRFWGGTKLFIRSRGGVRARVKHVMLAWVAGIFPDGWICRAVSSTAVTAQV
jgi:hypothetical protein